MAKEPLRQDIEAARGRMRAKIGAGREMRKLPEHLWEGETVEYMTGGAYGAGTGLLVLTDRRLLFLQDGIMSKTSEDFPLDKVSSVQWSSGLLLGTVTIFASGNKAEVKNVNKDDGKAITDQVRNRLSAPKGPPPAAPAAAPTNPDPFEQLRKLGELRDAGIVTPEEFEAKKSEILSRL